MKTNQSDKRDSKPPPSVWETDTLPEELCGP